MLWCSTILCYLQAILAIIWPTIHLPLFILQLRAEKGQSLGKIQLLLHRTGPLLCIGIYGFFIQCYSTNVTAANTSGWFYGTSAALMIFLLSMVCFYLVQAVAKVSHVTLGKALTVVYYANGGILFVLTYVDIILIMKTGEVWPLALNMVYMSFSMFVSLLFLWVYFNRITNVVKKTQQQLQDTSITSRTEAGKQKKYSKQLIKFKRIIGVVSLLSIATFLFFLISAASLLQKPHAPIVSKGANLGTFGATIIQCAALSVAMYYSWTPISVDKYLKGFTNTSKTSDGLSKTQAPTGSQTNKPDHAEDEREPSQHSQHSQHSDSGSKVENPKAPYHSSAKSTDLDLSSSSNHHSNPRQHESMLLINHSHQNNNGNQESSNTQLSITISPSNENYNDPNSHKLTPSESMDNTNMLSHTNSSNNNNHNLNGGLDNSIPSPSVLDSPSYNHQLENSNSKLDKMNPIDLGQTTATMVEGNNNVNNESDNRDDPTQEENSDALTVY